jgi:hypothetical protein
MMGMSWAQGLSADAARQAPLGRDPFFQGLSNIIFTFGGHCMLL